MNTKGMRSAVLAIFFAGGMTAAASGQDGENGGPLFEQGGEIYENNCAMCHQSSGEGSPPTFPALDGNDNLSETELIVDRVHNGEGAMPAFDDLGSEQIAAVASYVRNAWDNAFGPVTADEVDAILSSLEEDQAEAGESDASETSEASETSDDGTDTAQRSIWDGVYTEDQAEEARLLYLGSCAACHGSRLNGAADVPDMQPGPPLTGQVFLRDWDGRSVGTLYEYIRTQMPLNNPGQFSDQQYIDIVAYMLSYDEDIPAGDEPLEPDMEQLQNIVIEENPDE